MTLKNVDEVELPKYSFKHRTKIEKQKKRHLSVPLKKLRRNDITND